MSGKEYFVYEWNKAKIPLVLIANDAGKLVGIEFLDGRFAMETLAQLEDKKRDCSGSSEEELKKMCPCIYETKRQLQEYFDGMRKKFSLPCEFERGTGFQREVWSELENIPYGTTISYTELAKRVKRPLACRPVGGAVGKNPISIVVPCHRIVGSNGSLVGFGGGIPNKRALLKLELQHLDRDPTNSIQGTKFSAILQNSKRQKLTNRDKI